jgi:hypothetical protein
MIGETEDHFVDEGDVVIPECIYCGARLDKNVKIKGFTVLCPECKHML